MLESAPILPLGHQLLLELWGVSAATLDSLETLEELLVGAATDGGAHPVETRFHRFAPQGVSGVVILAESHITVHTWPELGYAAVDVFTCGSPEIAAKVGQEIVSALCPQRFEERKLQRGLPTPMSVSMSKAVGA